MQSLEVHSAHAVNHLSKTSWHFNYTKNLFQSLIIRGGWKVLAENEYQNLCQGAPATMENITWSAPSYSLYSQDVHSCCCSSSHKEKLPRCTRRLACCGRVGRTSCSPRQAHNVTTVVLYSFALLGFFFWRYKRCFVLVQQNEENEQKRNNAGNRLPYSLHSLWWSPCCYLANISPILCLSYYYSWDFWNYVSFPQSPFLFFPLRVGWRLRRRTFI